MSPASKKQLSGVLKVLAVVLVVTLGIWGCARKPADQVNNDRIRALEARCVKLEQDYRTVAQARDKARKELAVAEEALGRVQRDGTDRESLIKERDELRRQSQANEKALAERTAERDQLTRELSVKNVELDTVVGRYNHIRKALQSIVTQDNTGSPPNTATGATSAPVEPAGPSLNSGL